MTSTRSFGINSWLAIDGYEVALPITFESGAGVTCSISPQQVRFHTTEKVAVGDQLIGRIALSGDDHAPGILRYRARVSRIHSLRSPGAYEVEARFEHYELSIS